MIQLLAAGLKVDDHSHKFGGTQQAVMSDGYAIPWNILIDWEDGPCTFEPLDTIAVDDPWKHLSLQSSMVYKCGYEVPRTPEHALQMDAVNNNTSLEGFY